MTSHVSLRVFFRKTLQNTYIELASECVLLIECVLNVSITLVGSDCVFIAFSDSDVSSAGESVVVLYVAVVTKQVEVSEALKTARLIILIYKVIPLAWCQKKLSNRRNACRYRDYQ